VGRASPLLTARAAAFGTLLAALVAYYLLVDRLWEASLWWDIAWLDLALMPAVFGLVYLALPLWRLRGLLWLALLSGVVAAICEWQDVQILGNFAKLAAMTFVAFWFLGFFESLSWVVLVASIIPLVDAYSVWKGPTKEITTNHEETFYVLSIAFPAPGDLGGANLGLPDLLFFALFLAAAARFGLRVFWTWLAGVVSFGATMALAVGLEVDGLPALPLLSVGFLLVNADLIWRRLRPRYPADQPSA
jgi:hypothetical protein